jgi:hypothetical protein
MAEECLSGRDMNGIEHKHIHKYILKFGKFTTLLDIYKKLLEFMKVNFGSGAEMCENFSVY